MLTYIEIPLFLLLLVMSVVLLIQKRWKLGVLALIFVFILNAVSETFPTYLCKNNDARADFKVLCYNVRSSDSLFFQRQKMMAESLIAESADVFFLCEFSMWRGQLLDSIMTDKGHYNRYYKSGTDCIYYSKYPIDSIRPVYSNPIHPKRTLTNRVNVMVENDTITIVGCHLSSGRNHFMEAYDERCKEADSIYAYLQDVKNPIIVMGDMNDISGSYAINRIKSVGLVDAWWKGGNGYGTTFHGKGLRLRIDHILYQESRLKLQNVKVIDSDLSDHNALVAEFSLK